jgi:hypothetical protein
MPALMLSRSCLERHTVEGESPVDTHRKVGAVSRVYGVDIRRRKRETVTPNPKYVLRPIAN